MALHPVPDIALYLKDLRAGGAQRVFLNLCRGFINAGLTVDMVLARGEGALLEQLPEEARLVDLGARGALAAVPALRRYVKERRPTVLMASINYVNVTALLATTMLRTTGATRVFVREANILNENTFRRRSVHDCVLLALMRRLYRRAESVIVNAEDTRTSLVKYGVVGNQQIDLIPNPVDVQQIQRLATLPAPHPWLNDASHPSVVLAVGSLGRQKNFSLLLRAFALVPGNARLIILGEGSERTDLEVLAQTLGIQNRVSLPGFSDNPFAYLSRAHLFVLSSLWEGSANVLVEALACGTPVIATDCPGGAREVLGYVGEPAREGSQAGCSQAGSTFGTLVPSNNIQELAHAIVRMLALSPSEREVLQTRARGRAEMYNLATVTEHYRRVLQL